MGTGRRTLVETRARQSVVPHPTPFVFCATQALTFDPPPLGECEERRFLASPPSMAAGVSSWIDTDDRELRGARLGVDLHHVTLTAAK